MEQQQPNMQEDPNANMAGGPYAYYPPEENTGYGLQYTQEMSSYQVVHAPQPPRQISATDLQHALQFRSLSIMPNHQYPTPVYDTSPQHVPIPLSASPTPPSPGIYNPLSPPVSGSDTSGEGIYHSRNNSGAGSPTSSRANSLVHRHPLRYNPTPSPTSSSGGRLRGRSINDSDDEEQVNIAASIAGARKEATRKQRIEAEQRRRDELRDGYAKLKDVLPVSNQKSSKVSLLERATNHIIALDKSTRQMQARLTALEAEVARLRAINEKLSLGVSNTPSPGHTGSINSIDARPLSPPPESHSLTAVLGQEAPNEDSSGSECEF